MGWRAAETMSDEEWKEFFRLMKKINGQFETEEEQQQGVYTHAKEHGARVELNEFLYCSQPEERQ